MRAFEKERQRKKAAAGPSLATHAATLRAHAADYCAAMQVQHERRTVEYTRQLLAVYAAQQAFFDDSARIMKVSFSHSASSLCKQRTTPTQKPQSKTKHGASKVSFNFYLFI